MSEESWSSVQEPARPEPVVWASIVEAPSFSQSRAAGASQVPEGRPPARIASGAVVLRGVPTGLSASGPRARLTIGLVVLALTRVFSFAVSAFTHVVAMIFLVGFALYTERQDRDVLALEFAPSGVSEKKVDVQGEKGKHNELPETQPVPPTPEPPKTETPVEPAAPPAVIAAPSSSGTPTPSVPVPAEKIYSGRGGEGRAEMLKKHGGTQASEAAVEGGLRWLATHMHGSGGWDANLFINRCPMSDRCHDISAPGDPTYSVGVSSLCILAFLGAGYRPDAGEFRETISKSLDYLVRVQRQDGGISSAGPTNFYNHALATWALCETVAITGEEKWRSAAQRAVNYLAREQRRDGGWDYFSHEISVRERNDTSIAGWAVMALKSAQIAKLDVPRKTMKAVTDLIVKRTDASTGELIYAEREPGTGRRGDGLAAVGMVCRYYLGLTDPGPLSRAGARLQKNVPSWQKMKEAEKEAMLQNRLMTDANMYYWYYGTLAMFQVGGEAWTRWNTALRDMLVSKQRTDSHRAGSWDPEINYIGREGGRVWATAINVLNLEVYYRYLPLYLLEGVPGEQGASDARKERLDRLKEKLSQGDLVRAMTQVAELKDDAEAIAALVEKLKHEDSVVRWTASKLLAQMGAKSALPALIDAAQRESSGVKGAMLEHLAKFKDRSVAPLLIACLSDGGARTSEGAYAALRLLAGADLGRDPAAWRRWHDDLK